MSKRSVLLFLAVILFLTAWNRGIPLLYLMFSMVLATLLLGQLLPLLSLGRIEVERTAPAVAVVGDTVRFNFKLRNLGLLPRFMLEVVDHFPGGEYGRSEPMLFISHLPSHRRRQYELEIPCVVRGEFTLGPLRLISWFPLGIANTRKEIPNQSQQILIYPATFPIAALPISPLSTTHRESGESISIAGGSEEFFGIREYREGDPIKKVHWPSSARRGQLLVKEMEVRVSAQISLLIDLYENAHAGVGAEHSLEYLIRIAASVCRHVLERQHQIQLLGYGEHLYLSPCRSGTRHLRDLMTMLAKAKSGRMPFSQMIRKGDSLMQDGQSVFLICSGHSLDRLEMQQALALLRAKRMQIFLVLVETAGFGGKDHPLPDNYPAVSGIHYYRMAKGEPFSALFAKRQFEI